VLGNVYVLAVFKLIAVTVVEFVKETAVQMGACAVDKEVHGNATEL
jgi:hypothetical protein